MRIHLEHLTPKRIVELLNREEDVHRMRVVLWAHRSRNYNGAFRTGQWFIERDLPVPTGVADAIRDTRQLLEPRALVRDAVRYCARNHACRLERERSILERLEVNAAHIEHERGRGFHAPTVGIVLTRALRARAS